MYPFLKRNKKNLPGGEERKGIYKNVYGMVLYKIGVVIVNSTDSVIISAAVSLKTADFFSNYSMIMLQIKGLLDESLRSTIASIGNMTVMEDEDYLYKRYRILNGLFYWGRQESSWEQLYQA